MPVRLVVLALVIVGVASVSPSCDEPLAQNERRLKWSSEWRIARTDRRIAELLDIASVTGIAGLPIAAVAGILAELPGDGEPMLRIAPSDRRLGASMPKRIRRRVRAEQPLGAHKEAQPPITHKALDMIEHAGAMARGEHLDSLAGKEGAAARE